MNFERGGGIRVCKFVKIHYPQWRTATMRELRTFFRWYWDRGLLAVAWHRGQVAAVGTARPFERREDYWQPFAYVSYGRFVKCSLYGTLHPVFIAQLAYQLAERHGADGRLYLWHRHEELGPPRQYRFDQLKKFLLRLIKV